MSICSLNKIHKQLAYSNKHTHTKGIYSCDLRERKGGKGGGGAVLLTGITLTTPPPPATASTIGPPFCCRKERGSQRYSTCAQAC